MPSPQPGPVRPAAFLRSFSRFLIPGCVPLVALLVACSGGGEEADSEPDVYSVRGIVRQVPADPRPGGELFIHHEAIPDFRDEDGAVVGMDSMAMPFPVAEETELGSLAAGDRIRFSFEVRWKAGGNPLQLTSWEHLGEDVLLEFEQPSADSEETTSELSEEESSAEEEAPGDGPLTSP